MKFQVRLSQEFTIEAVSENEARRVITGNVARFSVLDSPGQWKVYPGEATISELVEIGETLSAPMEKTRAIEAEADDALELF